MLLSYIQKNASYEVQKAVAVSLMATAMTTFGQDITNAARVASEYTQFSEQTVRKWAFSYFVGLNNASPENVNNETIESELSSERGLCHSCPSILIHEGFQMAAKTYVRENAYAKGEPNLTVGNFTARRCTTRQLVGGSMSLGLTEYITRKVFTLTAMLEWTLWLTERRSYS